MKFTEEEIRENVIVPANVEMERIRLVEEKLNQCGVFYRVYSRIKKASSLERKYNDKEYDNEKILTEFNKVLTSVANILEVLSKEFFNFPVYFI